MSEALKRLVFELDDPDVVAEYKRINAVLDMKFFSDELLKEIHLELDKRHKLDHKEKLGVFIVAISSYLKDPKDHCSCALKGNSSAGKDSCVDTVLSHIPKDDWIKVTRATTATLEDDVKDKRIIAFSEINKNRERGANAEIVETFKQMAEGGTTTLKKDAKTGFKTAIRTDQEQKTLIYGTTETESDEELETRYVIIPITGYKEKNKIVISDTLKKARDVSYYLAKTIDEESWIATSISLLDKDCYVILPFTDVLDKEVSGKEIFDTTKDRVKRDVKRIISLTRAITWLYQKQRVTKTINNVTFIYAEPSDFLNALIIFSDFINLTYSGIDHRLQRLLDYAKENIGNHCADISNLGFEDHYCNWILRHKAQQDLGISSVNTIKRWIAELKDKDKIDVYYNAMITNKAFLFRPINSPISSLAIPVKVKEIDSVLTDWLNSKEAKEIYEGKEIAPYVLDFVDYDKETHTFSDENDMSRLTGSNLVVEEEFICDDEAKNEVSKFDYQKVLTVEKEDKNE
ncbi:hypothetical protein K9M74_01160 [Candidatus Woesearchaeota archaeon]|nr:hypothetical protein [Candidatus Woesearchaeota archaeon]